MAFGRDLPHQTEVTLTESTPGASARFTWDAPQWAGSAVVAAADGTAVVTIGSARSAEVGLTNNATAVLGSLEVTKALTGDGAGRVPASTAFPVTATWTDLLGQAQTAEVTVAAGASAVLVDIPVGTDVRLTEGRVDLPANVKWTGGTWTTASTNAALQDADRGSGAVTVVVTGDAGATASLAVANAFDPAVEVAGLAVTGTDLAVGGTAAAGALLLALGAFLVLRRRHTA